MKYSVVLLTICLGLLPLSVMGHEGEAHTSEADRTAASLEFRFLDVGEIAPDFTLINQDGIEVSFKGFRGKAVLLTFIYTNCPTSCPITTKKFV